VGKYILIFSTRRIEALSSRNFQRQMVSLIPSIRKWRKSIRSTRPKLGNLEMKMMEGGRHEQASHSWIHHHRQYISQLINYQMNYKRTSNLVRSKYFDEPRRSKIDLRQLVQPYVNCLDGVQSSRWGPDRGETLLEMVKQVGVRPSTISLAGMRKW